MNRQILAYVGATFDMFHAGHVNFLRQCSKIADKIIVSLNTDEFIKEYKGEEPVMTYEERKEVLLACQYVDEVIPNTGGADSKPAILKANPNIIAIGTDWAGKNYYKQMDFTQEWLDKQGIVLVYLPYTQDISTTEIKRRLK